MQVGLCMLGGRKAMNEFNLTFWELQEVWNLRVVSVKTDKNPLKLTLDDINDDEFDIEWIDVLNTDYGDTTKIEDIKIVNDAFNIDLEAMDKYSDRIKHQEEE
tara:strand:+ start:1492 stop:1800 length:309 start_codon:yes stop_codon:yes gene_type:complete